MFECLSIDFGYASMHILYLHYYHISTFSITVLCMRSRWMVSLLLALILIFYPSTLHMWLEYIILCTNAIVVLNSVFHFGTKNHFLKFLALDPATADCGSLKCIDCSFKKKKHIKIVRSFLQWPERRFKTRNLSGYELKV